MTAPPAFTVFYAWQSDRKAGHHRYFIQEALHDVAERINEDSEIDVEVVIDHDTKGVTGLCDIPATILSKIERCDAFVADLTFIGLSDVSDGDDGRHCSNPNVLFELGFAFHAVGWERLILVMNDAHGPAAHQIFDLDHRRHPISYTLPKEGKSKAEIKADLTNRLEQAIRSTITSGPRIPLRSVEDQFHQVAAKMPELIAEMRDDLTDPDSSILRDFYIFRSTASFNHPGAYLCYHTDQHDNLAAKVTLLENCGFIEDITEFGKNTPKYRMTEEFVDLVTHVVPNTTDML